MDEGSGRVGIRLAARIDGRNRDYHLVTSVIRSRLVTTIQDFTAIQHRMWFDPPENLRPGRDERRMRQISAESEAQETSKIQTWLDLAQELFEPKKGRKRNRFFGDDDPTPSAA